MPQNVHCSIVFLIAKIVPVMVAYHYNFAGRITININNDKTYNMLITYNMINIITTLNSFERNKVKLDCSCY